MKYPKFFVFDIETAALSWESFDEAQQEYLLRGATTDDERDKKIRELALSPMTSRIVCICLAVMEWPSPDAKPVVVKQGALMLDESLPDGKERRTELSGGVSAVALNEHRLVTSFWKILEKYYNEAHIVTFNGMDFDAPFLVLRSAALGVRPTRNIAVGKPWDIKEKHVDLQKELQLHAFGNNGATRRYNFDFYARAFGIESPKSQGVHGGNVAELYAEGRHVEIAEYCMRDVRATWELFLKWHEYLYFE
jgi:DNA polymerase elongation subunit (family B)